MRGCSVANIMSPEFGHTHTSLMSAGGSIDANSPSPPVPLSHIACVSQTLRIFLSEARRYEPSGVLWKRRSMIACPYCWSFTLNGRLLRRSKSAVNPPRVPAAILRPSGLNRTAVTCSSTSEPSRAAPAPCDTAAATSTTPLRRLFRGSQHSTDPASVPMASRPWTGLRSRQLTASESTVKGFRKRPCSRFRRYTSLLLPPMMRSQLTGSYTMSRPTRGMRVL
mmetsp:Transcript_17970/g.28687  ORF Transcript_17970/g.28687 Transcript_17970/m.28687 type:complete len:223 (+) Transcript_17970:136-804(+)